MSDDRGNPSPLSLVRFTGEYLTDEELAKFPIPTNHLCIYLGEIPNMKGHCVVVGWRTGIVYSGYHIEDFVELPEDET